MKNTMTMTIAAKQMYHKIGARGTALVIAAVMFLLLAGMSMPGFMFNSRALAAQEAGGVTHRMVLPSADTLQKTVANVPTLDVRYTVSSEKSLSERRGHGRRGGGGAAASSSAASSGGGAAASSSAAAG